MNFSDAVRQYPLILTEGALIERLRHNPELPLDPEVLHAGFIYGHSGQEALREIFREYLAIGQRYDWPMVVFSPTWRANPERLNRTGLADRDVNGDAVRFTDAIRRDCSGAKVYIGGLMGCRGDAYDPAEALDRASAASFHRFQAEALIRGGVDFLMGATLPALSEALGMADAMSGLGRPYLLSFVVRPEGCLLDGHALGEAVDLIDREARERPLAYLVNCVHPLIFSAALKRTLEDWPDSAARVWGLQANASPLSPEDLDGMARTESEAPESFAEAMLSVRDRYGLKILGGCCGTDRRHIEAVASMAARPGLGSNQAASIQ